MTSTPFTFEAIESGTVSFHKGKNTPTTIIHYCINGGDWTQYVDGNEISVFANDIVSFAGTNSSFSRSDNEPWSDDDVTSFSSTCDGYVYGNILSLLDQYNFSSLETISEDYCFAKFFYNNHHIRNHETKDLLLPATTLSVGCYFEMFSKCTGLTRTVDFPAEVLKEACYYCMYSGCNNLLKASDISANTLATWCCWGMFTGCTSLTKAPALTATTQAGGCYDFMFENCTNLNTVKCLSMEFNGTDSWLHNVSSTGTFIRSKMADWERGWSGIPEGWNVEGEDGTETLVLEANSDDEGSYWATFYHGSSGCVADDNTIVYTATVSEDKSKVVLKEVEDKVVPAENAVILKSSSPTVSMTYKENAEGIYQDNDLCGSSTSIRPVPDNTYMLAKGHDGIGFYHWTGASIPNHRGYLILGEEAQARDFIPFCGDIVTSIMPIVRADNCDVYYDLLGRVRNNNSYKSILIKKGKKIFMTSSK